MIIKTGTLEPIVPTGTDWNIEFDCRTKTLKSVSLPLIVSGENNSTVLLIKTPLYYNSVDLTTVNCIVKYKTSWIKEDGSVNEGQVDLTNTATKFDDYIIYTWALDQRQTRLPGKCDFSLKFFMNLNEDPYQNQTRYYLQKISNENGESLQIGKDEMITDIEQKYWSIASLPSSINIGDSGSIAEGVEPDDSMADSGYDDGYNQGYEDGKNSVVDVARTLKSAKFQNLNLFGKTELVLNLDVWESNFQNLFQITSEENRNVTCKHLTINCPYAINSLNQMLYCQYPYTDETLKRLTLNFDTQKCVNYLNAFTQMRALEVIDGKPLDFASVTSASNTNAFPSCASLKEVRFVPNTIKLSISFANCSNLSSDTIQSIIDGLTDLTGGTAQTLTLHATVGSKLTDEQKATITAKNWELVY